MNHVRRSFFAILLSSTSLILMISAGCRREEKPFRKVVIPVSGTVTVDGKVPETPVQIACHPKGGMDVEHPTLSNCVTAKDGTFKVTTYETGDGVPEGEYDVTFVWKEFNMLSGRYQGADQLKGRYELPEKSKIQFKAEKGKPVDLGTIELTTK